MGIFDRILPKRPRPGTGMSAPETAAEEVEVPKVDETINDIDRVLAEAEAQTKKSERCGCW